MESDSNLTPLNFFLSCFYSEMTFQIFSIIPAFRERFSTHGANLNPNSFHWNVSQFAGKLNKETDEPEVAEKLTIEAQKRKIFTIRWFRWDWLGWVCCRLPVVEISRKSNYNISMWLKGNDAQLIGALLSGKIILLKIISRLGKVDSLLRIKSCILYMNFRNKTENNSILHMRRQWGKCLASSWLHECRVQFAIATNLYWKLFIENPQEAVGFNGIRWV